MSRRLRLDLLVRTYPEGDRWTWRLFSGSRIVSTSGAQLFSRRNDCAHGSEEGAGLTGVEGLVYGIATKSLVGHLGTVWRHGASAATPVSAYLLDERTSP